MQIRLEQLDKQALSRLYILSGEEQVLIEEARKVIVQMANQSGFTEKELIAASAQYNWASLYSYAQNFSLFSAKKILDIRASKLSEKASDFLLSFVSSGDFDTLIIISCDKIDSSQRKTKWWQRLEKQAVFVPIWPLEGQALKRWLTHYLKQKSLHLHPDALEYFCHCVQGNLYSAVQDCEKLSLLFAEAPINLAQIQEAIGDNARFDLYDVQNALLQKDLPTVLRQMQFLKLNQTEPTLVLWALTRLLQICLALQEASNTYAVFQQYFIRQADQGAYLKLSKSLSIKKTFALLQKALKIDMAIKGLAQESVWDELVQLAFELANHALFTEKAI